MDEVAHQSTRELEQFTYAPQGLGGTPTEVRNQRIEEAQKWLMKANAAVDYWHDDLAVDYRSALELIEAADLRIVAQSLRDGLGKYLVEEDSYLKAIDPLAWEGLHERWPNTRATIAKFLKIISNYFSWLTELRDRDSQITDPIGLRSMVHQKSTDTELIIAAYAELVSKLKPVIEEALQFLR